MIQRIQKVRWLFFAFALFLLDQVTKLLTHLYIPLMSRSAPRYPYGGVPLFKNFLGIEFSLSHTTNKGAAWGAFADSQVYLLLFRIVFIAGVVIYLTFFNKKGRLFAPLLLVVTGAISNVLDFFAYGHVVDMLHFVFWGYDYPVFNVADVMIFVGIFWLLWLSFTEEKADAGK